MEFKLPGGLQLAKEISSRLNWEHDGFNITRADRPLYEALKRHEPTKADEFFQAGRLISECLPLSQSIDDFLYVHSEKPAVVLVGKAAIARAIIESERASRLFLGSEGGAEQRLRRFHDLADTWLYKLFSRLWTNVPRRSAEEVFAGLHVINFNYDRCVEQFLAMALRYAYGMPSADAQAIVAERLDISHPTVRSAVCLGKAARRGASILERILASSDCLGSPAKFEPSPSSRTILSKLLFGECA